uniref:Uncharacterized protein n=1 Tax=Anopheles albimanus TaxID=7167 RepID=A0A182F5H8_ANOAL
MSVCVSNAGVTLGVDAMSLSQMTLPSAMMLPLGHSAASSMMSNGMLVGMDVGNSSNGMPLPNGLHHSNSNATVGQNGHGGLSVGALSHGTSSGSSSGSSSNSNNGGIAGPTTSVAAAVAGTELIGGDHHPNPEMLLALIARNKALEDLPHRARQGAVLGRLLMTDKCRALGD